MKPIDRDAQDLEVVTRHHDDAEFLHQSGRVESSILLSILALEVAGRLLMRRQKEPGANLHKKKQQVAASYLLAYLFTEGVESAGLEIVKLEDVTPGQRAFLDELEKDSDARREWETRLRETLVATVDGWPNSSILPAVQNGLVYDLRNFLLYGKGDLEYSAEELSDISRDLIAMCNKLKAAL